MADGTALETNSLNFQLYEIDGDPNRKEFLDDLFIFMQKRGEFVQVGNALTECTARMHACVQARPHTPTPTLPTTSLPPRTQCKLNSTLVKM